MLASLMAGRMTFCAHPVIRRTRFNCGPLGRATPLPLNSAERFARLGRSSSIATSSLKPILAKSERKGRANNPSHKETESRFGYGKVSLNNRRISLCLKGRCPRVSISLRAKSERCI